MSKMFDSLRRAEEERRKKAVGTEREAVAEPVAGTSTPTAFVSAGLLPEGFAREIGVLRNSIESALKGKNRRSILFTSSVVSEGATTLAVNYAKLIAMHGSEKVLLCELNARRPSFTNLFSIEPEPGIGSVFAGKNTLSAVISHIDAFNLSVAPIGVMDLAALQQHFSSRFPALLREAFETFTTVVFDAPAVSVSPETAPMCTFVDGVVIVVQEGKTKREVIQRSIGAIQQQEGKILGVVLNRKKYYIPEFLYKRI